MSDEGTRKGIPAWQDRAGRIIAAACSLAALWAFINGVSAVSGSPPDRVWLETWRTLGFFLFTGLFAVLAWRPRRSAGIWELTFANKAALAALGFAYGSTEGMQAAPIDAALALLLVAAYLLTRGWRAWRRRSEA